MEGYQFVLVISESSIGIGGVRLDHVLDKRNTIFVDSLVGGIPGSVDCGAKHLRLKPLFAFLSGRLDKSPEL